MIEDKATENLKKRLKDIGLIVNLGADKLKRNPAGGRGAKVNVKPSKKGNKK